MRFLDHDADCPRPSEFYAVRGGWCWCACRFCTATQVRRPAKETRNR